MTEVYPYPDISVEPDPDKQFASFLIGKLSVDRKPNLYLYPPKKTKVNVSLEFPKMGKVVESIPSYPEEWEKISVKANGRIDKNTIIFSMSAGSPISGSTSKAGW